MLSRVLRNMWNSRKDASARSGVALPPRSPPAADRVPNFFSSVFWGAADPASVTEAAKRITEQVAPGHHFGDNFLTWGRNLSMLDDEAFVQAWRANIESPSDEAIIWRRYILATSAFHCVQLDGDFVECGAYTGVGMKTVIDYLGGRAFPKVFWGYDAFEHSPEMLNHPMPGLGPELYPRIQDKFAEYPQVRLLKGLIPQVFADGCPDRIAYLHIDLNQAPAEIDVLTHLFDRVVPGGMVILDDYEWAGIYRPQKLAEDPWFDQRGYRVMPLPTGQGLVIKR
ncbi:MAG: TylF/MycF family methyltransferase [Anaerolineae bacterium]|nr:TylF/MycF family methyltransferase [Anaerolineae bacterium]